MKTKKTFDIVGIKCKNCLGLIELNLAELEGITKIQFKGTKLEVGFDEDKLREDEIVKTIKDSGYDVK